MDSRIIIAIIGAIATIIGAIIIVSPLIPTPTPTMGSISVSSFPSGASIYLDGDYKGTTPMEIKNVEKGPYAITLKYSGYQDWSQTIYVVAVQTIPVSPSLIPIPPTPTTPNPTSTTPNPTSTTPNPTSTTPNPTPTTPNPTPTPILKLYPSTPYFNFGTLYPGETGSRTISISNAEEEGTLTWSVNADKTWITVSPTSGTNAGTVRLNVNTIDLSSGSYKGTITVDSNGGTKAISLNLDIPVPTWSSCSWVGVETNGINSHQPIQWGSEGSFITAFDLDGDSSISEWDAPVIGQARFCTLAGAEVNGWSSSSWFKVEQQGINSHQRGTAWCPEGSFITAIDLDGDSNLNAWDSPVIGQVQCSKLAGSQYERWASSYWIDVGVKSHQAGEPWCKDGSFLTQFDLDALSKDYGAHDSPIVGGAKCSYPYQ